MPRHHSTTIHSLHVMSCPVMPRHACVTSPPAEAVEVGAAFAEVAESVGELGTHITTDGAIRNLKK